MRSILARALLSACLLSTATSAWASRFDFEALWMRNTSAASVARDANWAKGGPGQQVSGFADTAGVFRIGLAATGTVDTSAAYRIKQFAWPPDVLGPRAVAGRPDTSSNVWVVIAVRQDTVSHSWASNTLMDSLHVAAEFSANGIDWAPITGTPTVAFDATAPIPIGSGGVALSPILAAENNASAEYIAIALACQPQAYTGGAAILNKTLCMLDGYVRFLIGLPGGAGQFHASIGTWKGE